MLGHIMNSYMYLRIMKYVNDYPGIDLYRNKSKGVAGLGFSLEHYHKLGGLPECLTKHIGGLGHAPNLKICPLNIEFLLKIIKLEPDNIIWQCKDLLPLKCW